MKLLIILVFGMSIISCASGNKTDKQDGSVLRAPSYMEYIDSPLREP